MIRVPRSTLAGSCAHELDDGVERGVIEAVDLVVLDRDLARLDRIGFDEREEDAVDEDGRQLGHLGQMDVVLERRLRRELDDRLGDRRGVVAHPLELVGHVVERQQVAQVAGDRLLGGDRHRDQARDRALGFVDDRVALDDLEGQSGIVGGERPTGLPDGRLDDRAHAQDGVADEPFVAIERLARRLGEDAPRLVCRLRHEPFDLGIHGPLRTVLLVGHRRRSVLSRTGRTRSPRSAAAWGS